MKVTTSTGVVIDTEEGAAKQITAYAKGKGFDNMIGAVATFPNKYQTYVIIQDQQIIKETTSYESCCVFIDMRWLNENMS